MTEIPAKAKVKSVKLGRTLRILLWQLGIRMTSKQFAVAVSSQACIDWMEYDAHERYLEIMTKVFPRAIGDDETQAARFNELWQEIKTRFERFRNPIIIPMHRTQIPKPTLTVPCDCGCGSLITTKNARRRFLNKAHRQRKASRTAIYKAKRRAYDMKRKHYLASLK